MDKYQTKNFERYGSYEPKRTGILLVDPYNDFIHPDGKSYGKSKGVIDVLHSIDNMSKVVSIARDLSIKLFFVPHHRSEPNDYSNWKYPTNTQLSTRDRQIFAKDTWGGTFHDKFQPLSNDIIIKEHWGQNGFANTDLDHQIKQHDIDRVILIGMLANTCIEATGRMAMELGYHVTLVKDASAAFTWEHMHAAHVLNGPTYAHAILTTEELLSILQGKPVEINQ